MTDAPPLLEAERIEAGPAALAMRVKLAANRGTAESVLAVLAQDPAVTVRGAVALNPAASKAADELLAGDGDVRVRLLLARKLVAAAPEPAAPASLSQRAYDILATLVRDEAVRIRRLIAEELARLPEPPHALLWALAQDPVICVSEPVLRLSPILSAGDLLALLEAPPHAAAAAAIARRDGLPAIVADAIAASSDDSAIRTLLANPSAAIREETLDSLVQRSRTRVAWHEPLVRRPRLPDHAARALSEIVATHLLQVLAGRTDLAAGTLAELRGRLAARLAHPAAAAAERPAGDDVLLAEARQMDARGDLDEGALLDAARRGQARRVAAMLAVAAGVPLAIVDHAATLRSAKAFVSLVWKTGFTMAAAAAVQSLLGQIEPSAVLQGAAERDFPLGSEEMTWQLEFRGVTSD